MLTLSASRLRKLVLAGLLATAATPFAAHAQGMGAGGPAATDAAPTAPSDSSMVNLVRLLVEQKVLSAEKGEALMQQALAEAQAARAAAKPAEMAPPIAGAVRVPYIPETVRDQIKAELRNDVLAQAKEEGWASRDQAAPDWTRRVTFSGDIRLRSQSDLFAKTNTDQLFDFARMNQFGPFDVASNTFPFLNTRRDKVNDLRLRARLNLAIKVADQVDAGFQFATGDDNAPISTNATLGGGFGKRSLWLQQAWMRLRPTEGLSLTAGRMPNPFLHTELVFDQDLSFDGIAAQVDFGRFIGDEESFGAKLRGGAFPLDYGDPNYLRTQGSKSSFPQKYLISGQLELEANPSEDVNVKLGGAYHHYMNVQGELSTPCLVGTGVVDCSTDGRRPFFLTKGNTLSYLRQLATVGGAQLSSLPQFFGLTFDYRLVDLNMAATFKLDNEIELLAKGNYVRNIGFRRRDICRNGVLGEPFNNGGTTGLAAVTPICVTGSTTKFIGGNEGYFGQIRVGHHDPHQPGQWQVEAGYRYLETDAVLDSFTDSNFSLGGTNTKGYTLAGRLGIFPNVALAVRYLSGNQVAGEPLAIDVLQLDMTARF